MILVTVKGTLFDNKFEYNMINEIPKVLDVPNGFESLKFWYNKALENESNSVNYIGHNDGYNYKLSKIKEDTTDNFNLFCTTYLKHLTDQMTKHPDQYLSNDIYLTYSRMRHAIANMSFNKDSESFKKTCKELGIKHTYKAIKSFMWGN